MAELILPIKQGEELNIGFTIKQNGSVMDLSDYTIRVQVKKVPLVTYPSMIDKEITTVSDINDVGQINYPEQGQFVIHLKEEDTIFPPGDYALVISLEQPGYIDIISSKCCNKAIYRICEQ